MTHETAGPHRLSARIITSMLGAATAVTVVALVSIFFFLAYFSLPLLDSGSISALISWKWSPAAGEYGILAMLTGTLLSAIPAVAIAFPIGIGVVALANGLAPPWAARLLIGVVQFMTSVPTVVWAFVSAFLVVPWVRAATATSGFSWLAVVLTLAILVVPTIVLVLSAQLRQLPTELRLTASALGFNRSQYLLYVAFPGIRTGFAAALVLACGRAIGDTIISLMVSGNAPIVPGGPLDSLRTLTAHIALVLATDSQSVAYASLFASGLLLCLASVVLNLMLLKVRGTQCR
jgi:phosphate transport system permease protein